MCKQYIETQWKTLFVANNPADHVSKSVDPKRIFRQQSYLMHQS
jgi:hypothetical protein